jgi:hypothetical protein
MLWGNFFFGEFFSKDFNTVFSVGGSILFVFFEIKNNNTGAQVWIPRARHFPQKSNKI